MPRKLTVSDNIILDFIVSKNKALDIPAICSGVNIAFDKCCKSLDRLIAHKLVYIIDKKYKSF